MNRLNGGKFMFKKIKNFKNKFKEKNNRVWIYILGVTIILNILAASSFIYSLSLLSGIENVIRYGIMIFTVVMAIIFVSFYISAIIKSKKRFYILFLIFIAISIAAQGFVAFNIIKLYNPISNINKSNITYTTDLIVLKDSNVKKVKDLNKMTIGYISKDKAKEDNTISELIIKENNLNDKNTVKEYTDYAEMLNDLYDKKIDAVFISSNYSVMFNTIEKFVNIKDDVRVITSKSKEFKKKETITTNPVNKNIIKEPFTVLLMGVDSEQDGLDKNAAFNGDSLMLITFNPTTLNTTVLSIPRDTYVPITCFANKKKNKITHAAWQGVGCMQNTIENFTGIDIDYYVKMNFKGVVDLVDAHGGIDVDVPMKFCEQNSDRHWGSSTICLNEGMQHLNGEQALALARHRKTLALGDIQRGLNQQLVIEGMLKQLSNIDSLDKVNNILNTVSNNMDTNISTNQILSFYNVGKDVLLKSVHTSTEDLISMEKLYLDGYTKMIYDESFGLNLSNYVYYKSSLNAVVDAMKVNLGLKKAEMTKTFDFSINETYEKKVIGQGETDTESNISTLPSFIGKTESYASSWTSARNIKANFTDIKKGDKLYNDSYSEGQIVSQSVAQGTELNRVSSITFGIISKENETTENNDTASVCIEGTLNTKCYVPSLIGKTKADVDIWKKTLPVKVNIVLKNSTSDDSIVVSISQGSGTLLVEGSTITIKFEDKKPTNNDDENSNESGNNNNNDNNSNNDNNTNDNSSTDPSTPGKDNDDPDSKPVDPNTGIGNNTNSDSQLQIGG